MSWTWTVRGVRIDVNGEGKFFLPGRESTETWDTLDLAKKAVEAIAQRLRITLDLPCIQSDGAAVTLKRLNLGTGEFIVEPPPPNRYALSVDLYPDTPGTRALVAETVDLRKRLKELEGQLLPYKLRNRSGRRQQPGAGEELKTDWERAFAQAQADRPLG